MYIYIYINSEVQPLKSRELQETNQQQGKLCPVASTLNSSDLSQMRHVHPVQSSNGGLQWLRCLWGYGMMVDIGLMLRIWAQHTSQDVEICWNNHRLIDIHISHVFLIFPDPCIEIHSILFPVSWDFAWTIYIPTTTHGQSWIPCSSLMTCCHWEVLVHFSVVTFLKRPTLVKTNCCHFSSNQKNKVPI